MIPADLQDTLDHIDEALAAGNPSAAVAAAQAVADSVAVVGSLEVLAELVSELAARLEGTWTRLPAGHREVMAACFERVDSLCDGDAERVRSFADLVSPTTDLDLPWQSLRLEQRAIGFLYNFAPFADTGASVASKRLRNFGARMDVVSCSSLGRKEIDRTPLRVSGPWLGQTTALPLAPSWATWDAQLAWIRRAVDRAEEMEAEGEPYGLIYSRAMWIPSHYAGLAYKLRHQEKRWVAEYSDPVALDVEGLPRAEVPPKDNEFFDDLCAQFEELYGELPESEKGAFRMAELLPYAFADEILFTNDLQRDTMLSHIYIGALRERVATHSTVSNHPRLPREYYRPYQLSGVTPQTINIGYFGQFYATRGLGDLTKAMRMLPDDLRPLVKLHVFTGYVPAANGGHKPKNMGFRQFNDAVNKTMAALGDADLGGQVALHPTLRFMDFLGALDQFDYLIVNDAHSGEHHAVNPYLPSKYSDYSGSTSNIWSMCEPGSSLDQRPATVKTRLGEVEQVRRFLLQLVRRFQSTGERTLAWYLDSEVETTHG